MKGFNLEANDLSDALATESEVAKQPSIPAVNRVKVARTAGNTMKKTILGRDITFKREIIAAGDQGDVKKITDVFFLNERNQDLLNEHGVSDILPSIKKAGINDFEAYARPQGEKYELADGSRRRRACILGRASLAMWVAELSDKEMEYLSESGNKHKQASVYERGLVYQRWIKEGRYTSTKDLSREISASRRTIQRCLHAAELPLWLIEAYKTPNDMSAEASAKLYTIFTEKLISEDILKSRVDHCKIMWNHADYAGKDVTEALTYIKPEIVPAKSNYLAGKTVKITSNAKGVKIQLPPMDAEKEKELKEFIENLMK